MPEADKQRQGPGRRTRAGLRKLIFALIKFRIEGIEIFAVKFILNDTERFSETLEAVSYTHLAFVFSSAGKPQAGGLEYGSNGTGNERK